jgi:hypothetical protein
VAELEEAAEEWRVICVTVALISPAADRERTEAAMIFKHKPSCNADWLQIYAYAR